MDDGKQGLNFPAHESRHHEPDYSMFSAYVLKVLHIDSLSALAIAGPKAGPSDLAPRKRRQVRMTEKAR